MGKWSSNNNTNQRFCNDMRTQIRAAIGDIQGNVSQKASTQLGTNIAQFSCFNPYWVIHRKVLPKTNNNVLTGCEESNDLDFISVTPEM